MKQLSLLFGISDMGCEFRRWRSYLTSAILPTAMLFPVASRERYTPEDTGRPLSSRPSHTTSCVPADMMRETSVRTRWPVAAYTASSTLPGSATVKAMDVEGLDRKSVV